MAPRGRRPRLTTKLRRELMTLSRTVIEVCPRDGRVPGPVGARAAVSLHSHSHCSRETLDFVPGFVRGLPIVASIVARTAARYEREFGHALDFAAYYWRPPLSPAAVVESERRHLERRLDAHAFVSLTDHDTLEGPKALRAAGQPETPLSVEWSVPFGGTVFHLGVHGLPSARLDETERALSDFTAGRGGDLGELLDALNECRETFVVLNHPFWDLLDVGQMKHESALLTLLRAHHDRFHALELNGYRTWSENRRVLPLSEGLGLPLVGGGDRHGYAPNAIVNRTNATCFAEFAHELRVGRITRCVVFPEYAEPYAARVAETASAILRPDPGGRERWPQRVFTV